MLWKAKSIKGFDISVRLKSNIFNEKKHQLEYLSTNGRQKSENDVSFKLDNIEWKGKSLEKLGRKEEEQFLFTMEKTQNYKKLTGPHLVLFLYRHV